MSSSTCMRALAATATAAIWLFASFAHGADKLDLVRDEVRKGDSSGGSGSSSSASEGGSSSGDGGGDTSGCDAGEECGGDGSAVWALIIGFAFYLPHIAVEGEDSEAANGYFPHYPYQDREPGYMRLALEEEAVVAEYERTEDGGVIIFGDSPAEADSPPGTRSLALRVSLEYGHGIDDDIHKPAAYLLFSTRWRLGLEAGLTYLREQPRGELLRDQLAIGDANVIFRFAQSAHIQMRAGLGARMMYDDDTTDAGFNFTYQMDIFPVFPLVLSGSVDLGNLGRAFAMHGRGTVGFVFFGVEIFAGWDGFLFDNPYSTADAVTIHGPIGGVRGWL